MLKFFKKKSTRIKTLLISVIGILSTSFAISTIAWYSQLRNAFDPTNVTSSVITQYFDSGTGTQGDPFVITRPIHYYHLVELQESNTFSVNGTPFADAELYFQFGKKDIDGNASTSDDNVYQFYAYNSAGVLQEDSYSSILDMNYYSGSKALPPLGSSEHPFKGHISGNNLTISNLHINGSGYSDIGIFGYVANGATISNTYFEAPYIDAGGNSSSATSGTGHTAHSTHTYIGYIAGHVYNASTTFSNVYVNNCELTNTTGNPDEMINTYGYFGHVDFPSDVSAESASFAVEAKASDIHSAISSSYSTASGNSAKSRDTAYSISNTNYEAAVTNDGSTYSMGKYSTSPNYPYSLSTIGYTGGDTVTKHVRYYIGENNLGVIDTNTVQLDSEPADWSVKEDGTYIFWDTTDQCWYYAVVESETSQEQQEVNYNCFTISYVYNTVTYYLKYNNATLVATSTAPTNQTIDDYYFVFKPSAGSTGIAEFTSNSNSDNVYIYSPAHEKYLSIVDTPSNSQYTPTFVDNPNVQFVVNGTPYTTFLATVGGQQNGLFATTSVWSCRKVSDNVATIFTIGTPGTRQSVTGYTYNLTTSISAGDTVAICAGIYTPGIGSNSWAGYYVMSDQNNNQRSAVHTAIASNVLTIGTGCDFLLETGSQSGTFRLIDQSAAYRENNSGYLYAASSGQNQLKTNTLATAGTNADATIDIDEDGYAEIIFQGDNSRRYLYFNNQHTGSMPNGVTAFSGFFSCYAEKSYVDETSSDYFHLPKLYKKTTVYGSNEDYTTATEKTYASAAIEEQHKTEYGLRVAPLSSNSSNPSSYSNTNFNINPSKDVVFNMNTSQVTYEGNTNNYWAKVTTQQEVTSGDKYLIVYESSSTSATVFDGSLSTLDATNNKQTLTISDSTIAWNNTNDAYSFTITSSSDKYYIKSHSGYYIGRSASTNGLSTTTTANNTNYLNTISISAGVATITGTGNCELKYNTNNDQQRFRYFASGQQSICLYKLIESEGEDATYIGDLVGNRYDPSRIDVVGPVSYNSSYYSFTGTSSVTATPSTGNKFYTTSYVNGGITIIVDKTGSRDLGHLIFTYEDASNIPYFLVNSGFHTALNTAGARDVDTNGSDNIHSYLLNINTSTIASLAYCALDSSGNITAIGGGSVAQYVLVLGANTATHIQNVQYTFINAKGNVGNFGSVDYRTATYNADGTLTTASSNAQVASSAISIYYDINTADQQTYVKVSYDQATNTYTITATSTVTTTLTFFIYDNSAKVVYGGVTYYATDVVTITAS